MGVIELNLIRDAPPAGAAKLDLRNCHESVGKFYRKIEISPKIGVYLVASANTFFLEVL